MAKILVLVVMAARFGVGLFVYRLGRTQVWEPIQLRSSLDGVIPASEPWTLGAFVLRWNDTTRRLADDLRSGAALPDESKALALPRRLRVQRLRPTSAGSRLGRRLRAVGARQDPHGAHGRQGAVRRIAPRVESAADGRSIGSSEMRGALPKRRGGAGWHPLGSYSGRGGTQAGPNSGLGGGFGRARSLRAWSSSCRSAALKASRIAT